jgi:hypothetical protein
MDRLYLVTSTRIPAQFTQFRGNRPDFYRPEAATDRFSNRTGTGSPPPPKERTVGEERPNRAIFHLTSNVYTPLYHCSARVGECRFPISICKSAKIGVMAKLGPPSPTFKSRCCFLMGRKYFSGVCESG